MLPLEKFSSGLALLLVPFLLSGCATLSKDECIGADWYQVGREDGINGYQSDRIEDHREACREFAIIPNHSEYRRGRDDGLTYYCTPSKGYEQGKSGSTYHYVCPVALENGFMRGYRVGTQVHELNQQIREVESKIKDREKELKADNISEKQRNSIRNQIDDLERERSQLRVLRQTVELIAIF